MQIIRYLVPADAADFKALRLLAMQESPTAFGSSLIEEINRTLTSIETMFASQQSFALGVYHENQLIGVARCERSSRLKTQHKADIYGVYIRPEFRGYGLGKHLLEALLKEAKTLPGLETLLLMVSEHNVAARSLYQRLGFLEYGTEPDALRVDGQSIAEVLMRLELNYPNSSLG